MAQNAANWLTTHMERTHSLTHLHHQGYNHVVRSASSAITEFGIGFYLKVPEGEGANRSPRRKPANRFDKRNTYTAITTNDIVIGKPCTVLCMSFL